MGNYCFKIKRINSFEISETNSVDYIISDISDEESPILHNKYDIHERNNSGYIFP